MKSIQSEKKQVRYYDDNYTVNQSRFNKRTLIEQTKAQPRINTKNKHSKKFRVYN